MRKTGRKSREKYIFFQKKHVKPLSIVAFVGVYVSWRKVDIKMKCCGGGVDSVEKRCKNNELDCICVWSDRRMSIRVVVKWSGKEGWLLWGVKHKKGRRNWRPWQISGANGCQVLCKLSGKLTGNQVLDGLFQFGQTIGLRNNPFETVSLIICHNRIIGVAG